jgi:hypothetical protein
MVVARVTVGGAGGKAATKVSENCLSDRGDGTDVQCG